MITSRVLKLNCIVSNETYPSTRPAGAEITLNIPNASDDITKEFFTSARLAAFKAMGYDVQSFQIVTTTTSDKTIIKTE